MGDMTDVRINGNVVIKYLNQQKDVKFQAVKINNYFGIESYTQTMYGDKVNQIVFGKSTVGKVVCVCCVL